MSPCSFTISLSKKTNFLHCKNAAILLALAQALTGRDHVTESRDCAVSSGCDWSPPCGKTGLTHSSWLRHFKLCCWEQNKKCVWWCNYRPNYAWKPISVIWEEKYSESSAFPNCGLLEFISLFADTKFNFLFCNVFLKIWFCVYVH